MKRKIAAILASDIAQYSRLIAEDEEDTVRRLTSLRAVITDFITRDSGRVFSIAGDATFAEFPSAVEAVRCAIDIQESLRTRNLAYPPTRHMNLRIGITIGDVVDRDGALIGDGVNIAARLEGLADVGGICVSRAVYEQVANKLSVQFADIGEQQVKNIPTPVHAFMVKMRVDDGRQAFHPQKDKRTSARWASSAVAIAASVSALGIAALAYLAIVSATRQDNATLVAPPPATTSPTPPVVRAEAEPLTPETVPFVADRAREVIRDVYLSAPDHKALAISYNRIGFITGQKDDDTARAAALDSCQRANAPRVKCELYAVGNLVVSRRGRPPVPPEPWVIHDPSIERPFVAADVPLPGVMAVDRQSTELHIDRYMKAGVPKAFALSPRGTNNFYFPNGANSTEVVRRSLEACGSENGVPCMIIAVDNTFVVPIPKLMKVTGFFRTGTVNAIAQELRENVVRRLGNSTTGWSAVAAGTNGRVGIKVAATSEREAIDEAMADCDRQDRACRVIAIGPFLVERLSAPAESPPGPPPALPPPVVDAPTADTQLPPPPAIPVGQQANAESLIAVLAGTVPALSPSNRDDTVRRYIAATDHKALAVLVGSLRVVRASQMPTTDLAKERALEECQAYSGQPCTVVAIDGEVQTAAADGTWPTHDMPRVKYAGTFDPEQIPAVSPIVRVRRNIVRYANAADPKAVAYHPAGRVFVSNGAASQRTAEEQALSECNADPFRQGRGGPCYLYAVRNDVVLPQRRTAPMTP